MLLVFELVGLDEELDELDELATQLLINTDSASPYLLENMHILIK